VTTTVTGDGCDLTGLDANVAKLLADNEVPDAQASVVTTGNKRTFRADVTVVDDDGQSHGPRIVTASSCAELFDSVAVVIAMAVSGTANPLTSVGDMDAIEPIPAVEVPPSTDAVNLVVTRAALVRSPRRWSIDGYVAAARSLTSSEQIQVGARVSRGRRSLTLQLAVHAPEAVEVTTTAQIAITQTELTLAPCAHMGSLSGCALLVGGIIQGDGGALYGTRAVVVPMAATGLRVGWEHFLTPGFAVRVHVDARAMLTKATFDVDHMPVWESSRVEGSAAVGLLARFL
jgi:hypothetical protein